jgi:DNA-binding NarL/FixJ family response regulator
MIKVLLVDDEALVRSGLRMILEAAGDIAIVAEARDGDEAVGAVRRHRPDVVLMDVRMPGRDGLSAAEELARRPDAPKVVMLTTFDLDEYVHAALRAGAVGFLLKDTPPRDLQQAVRVVAAGDSMLSPSVTRTLIAHVAGTTGAGPPRRAAGDDALASISPREREVLVELAHGRSNAEIAAALFMSEATVKSHVTHLFTKLARTNRVQLAILAHDAGLV